MSPFKMLPRTAAALLALAACFPAAHAQGGLGQDTASWRASPQGAGQLGGFVSVGAWRLQKPNWARPLTRLTQPGRSSITVIQSWGSDPRANGTFPMLMLSVTDMQPGPNRAAPDGVMDSLEASTLRGKTNLVVASREYSFLHGLPAAREYWKYTVRGGGQLHGFFYVTVQGASFVAVTGMDAAPSHTLTLPALEAAALTLQSTSPAPQSASPAPIAAPAQPPQAAPARPADLLGEETPALGYKIKPPQGYVPVAITVANMQMAMWVGIKHPDGQTPDLMVARTPAPLGVPRPGARPPAQEALLGLLDSIQAHYRNVQTNPARTGAINGIPAVYIYWTGIAPGSGARVHGFGYGAQDGGTLLLFAGKDSEPTQSAALPVMDASVMTFHH